MLSCATVHARKYISMSATLDKLVIALILGGLHMSSHIQRNEWIVFVCWLHIYTFAYIPTISVAYAEFGYGGGLYHKYN